MFHLGFICFSYLDAYFFRSLFLTSVGLANCAPGRPDEWQVVSRPPPLSSHLSCLPPDRLRSFLELFLVAPLLLEVCPALFAKGTLRSLERGRRSANIKAACCAPCICRFPAECCRSCFSVAVPVLSAQQSQEQQGCFPVQICKSRCVCWPRRPSRRCAPATATPGRRRCPVGLAGRRARCGWTPWAARPTPSTLADTAPPTRTASWCAPATPSTRAGGDGFRGTCRFRSACGRAAPRGTTATRRACCPGPESTRVCSMPTAASQTPPVSAAGIHHACGGRGPLTPTKPTACLQ